ncbi:MAG TPA: IclR family transcriptional regulator [Solirubrobacteraceae bacterium]|nr:IclR family transcriptional regulator [Solirubrobacteraceae bacterium]
MSAQIQSIQRAAAVLRLLSARSGRRALAELASELDLPRGTVYGIVRTLQTVGFVEQDSESGKYQLGAALLHIGARFLNGNELRRRAITWADSLATRLDASVLVGMLHENHVLIVHHVHRPAGALQAVTVGDLMPPHATALGKALLAYHPRLVAELAAGGLERYTDATLTDLDRLHEELAEVADRGWASDVEELLPDVACIAAPIENRERIVVGAVAISGSVAGICSDRSPRIDLAEPVIECGRAISRELGRTAW